MPKSLRENTKIRLVGPNPGPGDYNLREKTFGNGKAVPFIKPSKLSMLKIIDNHASPGPGCYDIEPIVPDL